MKSFNCRKKFLMSSALVVFFAIAASNVAQAADPIFNFDIPAESLGQALTDFSQSSSQQIIYSEDLVRGRKSGGLHGAYTAEQALKSLLSGTDLKVETNSAGVLMVRPKNSQAASNERAVNFDEIETVTVTGTHIRDVEPLTPVTTISSKNLADEGYTRLDEAIQQLPQNFQGGVASTTNPFSFGAGAGNNITLASGVNLRGLGPGATLVLINGERVAPSANGTSVDISSIPVSVIDRVEILPDGASAVYGSDAVGGVVNIITKQDYSGVEVGARITGIANGKAPNFGGNVLGGFDWGSGNILINYDYEKDQPLYARNRSFSKSVTLDPTNLLPKEEPSSLYGAIRQSLSDTVTISANILASNRNFFNEENSSGTGLITSVGHSRQFAPTVRLDYALSADWLVSAVGQFSQQHDFAAGAYEGIGYFFTQKVAYETKSVEPRIEGTLFNLPGGAVHIAFGALYRQESLDRTIGSNFTPYQTTDQHRTVYSGYGELLVPLVSDTNALELMQELTLDIAGRYDHYSDFGSTFNPKISTKWTVTDDFSLHGSYSTSFKAPDLYDLDFPYNGDVLNATDPSSPTGSLTTLVLDGTTTLRAQHARSLSAGFTYRPSFIPGLTTDVSFFSTDYSDRIERLLTDGGIGYFGPIIHAAELGPYVTLNPTLAQVNSALASLPLPASSEIGPYSPSDIQAIAFLGYVNAAKSLVQGVDMHARYDRSEDFGDIYIDLDGSLLTSYEQQITPSAPKFSILNTIFNPLRFRAKANFGWHSGGWTANTRVNFSNSYHNDQDPTCPVSPGCEVSSWTTVDLGLAYATNDNDPTWAQGIRIAAAVDNVFNVKPPYTNLGYGFGYASYDPTNANPLQRLFNLTFSKRF